MELIIEIVFLLIYLHLHRYVFISLSFPTILKIKIAEKYSNMFWGSSGYLTLCFTYPLF